MRVNFSHDLAQSNFHLWGISTCCSTLDYYAELIFFSAICLTTLSFDHSNTFPEKGREKNAARTVPVTLRNFFQHNQRFFLALEFGVNKSTRSFD